MADDIKILGQAAPDATTDTDVYTVPVDAQAVISTIVIANRGATAGTFRLAARPADATIADEHYVAYDVPIAGNDSTTLTLGVTLDETDVLTFQASTADMSVNVFGTELS